MAETCVSGGTAGHDPESSSVTVPQGTGHQPVDPGSRVAMARFEREVAALDLSDAAQAASRSTSFSGSTGPDSGTDGDTQAEIAARLYASADEHRRRAERLLECTPDATEAE